MQEKDQSILTITRCISIVIQIRKQIDIQIKHIFINSNKVTYLE